MTKKQEWWQSFYENSPLELYMVRSNAAEMEESLAFLRDKLHLTAGDTIFDQCCGFGAMSIPLAQLGYRLIGVDLCNKYIAMASAASPGVDAQFHVGDAFKFLPLEACDAAFNWYTSFGYAREDRQNLKMIARAHQALKPGGHFALDFLNMPMIMQAFKKDMSTRLQSPDGEILQERACVLNLHEGTMDQKWTWTMPDGKTLEQESTLRAYMPCDLVRMFEQVGFVDVQLFGGTDGHILTPDSGRCIVVGRKAEAKAADKRKGRNKL